MLVGFLGLYAWVGVVEPDCHYSTETFLQIRLCGENVFHRNPLAGAWMPPVFGLTLLAGLVLRMRASRSAPTA